MGACCLAAGTREKDYLEVAGRYSKDDLNIFAEALASLICEMEDKPFTDVLGTFYMECGWASTRQARGEFYTPTDICKLLAKMTIGDVQTWVDRGTPVKCHEPACGAGQMILSTAELFAPDHVDLLRFHAWDKAHVAAQMCYINTSMWGIPAIVTWGNTITLEAYREWPNIHYARVGQLQIDRMRNMISTFESVVGENDPIPADSGEETPRQPKPKPTRPVQMEFDLKF